MHSHTRTSTRVKVYNAQWDHGVSGALGCTHVREPWTHRRNSKKGVLNLLRRVKKRLHTGKKGWDRNARQPPGGRITSWAAAAKQSCHFVSDAGLKAGSQVTRAIDTGLCSYVLTSLIRMDAPFWTYVVAPVTCLTRAAGHLPSCSELS